LGAPSGWWGGGGEGLFEEWWPGIASLDWKVEPLVLHESEELRRIRELGLLGLERDAGIEIRRFRIRRGLPLPNDPKAFLAGDGAYRFQLRVPRQEHPEYRLLYADHLFTAAEQAGLKSDPLLLYAMMRQESEFHRRAVSPAGAIGILQIMPRTGEKLARRLDWEEFEPRWLYDPVTNIELAVRYLRRLEEKFPNRWYATVAAYNAGEKAVKGWLSARGNLSEEIFIEEIPYRETRHYVKSVYVNFAAYRWIYRQTLSSGLKSLLRGKPR